MQRILRQRRPFCDGRKKVYFMMIKTVEEFLEEVISEDLILAVLSGCRKKELPSRVRIRPVELKGEILYQASATQDTKVIHTNYGRDALLEYMNQCLKGGYSQLQIQGRRMDGSILVSKKGKHTIKVKQHPEKKAVKIMSHNRVKKYILPEGRPVPFLIDLGVMSPEGKIHAASFDKYKQINRFLEFIDMEHTPKNLLIRAVKTGKEKSVKKLGEMTEALHAELTLEKLLYPQGMPAEKEV